MASDLRGSEAPRAPRSRRPAARAATTGAMALAAFAAAANACTQTHVVLAAPTVIAISTGAAHTCAIAEGALFCWGNNENGQLGLGDMDPRPSPTRVGTDADWQSVATGSGSSLALKVDGTMWSFGENTDGQLGLGDVEPRTRPTPVGERSDWRAIALRFQHACALARDGSLWCWGSNSEGQLGQDDTSATARLTAPRRVTTRNDFAAVDAGDGHTCAISTGGTLWCWGRNAEFELGQESPDQIRRPVKVGNETDWTVIRSGQNTTCGVRGNAAYCWGESTGDVAGMESGVGIPGVTALMKVSKPVAIGGPPVVVDLSFNTFGGAVLDDKGGAWLWGRNVEGQLGQGDMAVYPGVVPAGGSDWTQVSVGRFATCGIRGARPVCAGKNDSGQLGQGDASDSSEFVLVALPAR